MLLSKIFLVASLLIVCASAIGNHHLKLGNDTTRCTVEKGEGYNLLSSPNYPNTQRDAALTCEFVIDNPEMKTIFIQFIDFNFGGSSCGEDYFDIQTAEYDPDGKVISYWRIYGSSIGGFNGLLKYSFRQITIGFHSAKSSCRGFRLAYSLCSPTKHRACTIELPKQLIKQRVNPTKSKPVESITTQCTVEEGEEYNLLSSPNYPNSQINANLTCQFSIDNPELKTIFIQFIDLVLNKTCAEYSSMEFFDSDENENRKTIYSSYFGAVDGLLKYSFRKISIEFDSDNSSCRGFRLAYSLRSPTNKHRASTVELPKQFITTESNQPDEELTTKQCTVEEGEKYNLLSSPNYPNIQINANLTCQFLIDNSQLKNVSIEILDLNIGKSCCEDGIPMLVISNVTIDSSGNLLSEGRLDDFTEAGNFLMPSTSSRYIRVEFFNYKSSCRGFLLKYLFL